MTTAVPGGLLRYAVVNTGTIPIILGAAYGIERRLDSGWEDVAVPYRFPAWGLRLESGCRHGLAARLPEELQPGPHRLRLRLPADRDPHPGCEWVARQSIEPIRVRAEFDVTSGERARPGR